MLIFHTSAVPSAPFSPMRPLILQRIFKNSPAVFMIPKSKKCILTHTVRFFQRTAGFQITAQFLYQLIYALADLAKPLLLIGKTSV